LIRSIAFSRLLISQVPELGRQMQVCHVGRVADFRGRAK
jgi:hypothetical protein